MGLMVERPGRRWWVEVVQGLSFRSLASQVGCGGPQSQSEVGRSKGPSLLPIHCPWAQLCWGRGGGQGWLCIGGSPLPPPAQEQGLRAALGSWLRRSLG